MQQYSYFVKVFVSSTFNDMHDERDILMKGVLPEVRKRLAPVGIDVQFIDLRWGVNSRDMDEQQRDSQVLKDCIMAIDKSRNYFIGLLGEHYGWIPPQESWNRVIDSLPADRKKLICEKIPQPTSVTELEFSYGPLIDLAFSMRSLICFRKPEVYASMSPECRNTFVDSLESGGQEKVNALKERIREYYKTVRLSNHIYEYDCSWDPNKQRIVGLEKFRDSIISYLVKEILLYEHELKSDVTIGEYDDLWKQNDKDATFYGSLLSGRKDILESINQLRNSQTNQMLITSAEGIGKTALISSWYKLFISQYKEEISLVAYCRKTPSLNVILKQWLSHPAFDGKYQYSRTNYISTDELITNFHEVIISSERPVTIFMDDIDWLDRIDLLIYLLPLPENARFIATCDESCSERILKATRIKHVVLPPLKKNNTHDLIVDTLDSIYEKRSFPEVINAILSKEQNGKNGFENTLWTKLILHRLLTLTGSEIRSLRKENKDAGINELADSHRNWVDKSPSSLPLAIADTINTALCNSEYESTCRRILELVSMTKYGIKVDVIEAVLGIEWDELMLSPILNYLVPLLEYTPERCLIWRYESAREFFLPRNSVSIYLPKMIEFFYSKVKEDSNDMILRELLNLCLLCTSDIAVEIVQYVHDNIDINAFPSVIMETIFKKAVLSETWIDYMLCFDHNGSVERVVLAVVERAIKENNDTAMSILIKCLEKTQSKHTPFISLAYHICKYYHDESNDNGTYNKTLLHFNEESIPEYGEEYLWLIIRARIVQTELFIKEGDLSRSKDSIESLIADLKDYASCGHGTDNRDLKPALLLFKQLVGKEIYEQESFSKFLLFPSWAVDRCGEVDNNLFRAKLWKYMKNPIYFLFSEYAYFRAKDIYLHAEENFLTVSIYTRALLNLELSMGANPNDGTSSIRDEYVELYIKLSHYCEDEAVAERIAILLALNKLEPEVYDSDRIKRLKNKHHLEIQFYHNDSRAIALLYKLKSIIGENPSELVFGLRKAYLEDVALELLLMDEEGLANKLLNESRYKSSTDTIKNRLKRLYNSHKCHKLENKAQKVINRGKLVEYKELLAELEIGDYTNPLRLYLQLRLLRSLAFYYETADKDLYAFQYKRQNMILANKLFNLAHTNMFFRYAVEAVIEYGEKLRWYAEGCEDVEQFLFEKALSLIEKHPFFRATSIANHYVTLYVRVIANLCELMIRKGDLQKAGYYLKWYKNVCSEDSLSSLSSTYQAQMMAIQGDYYVYRGGEDAVNAFECYRASCLSCKASLENGIDAFQALYWLLYCQCRLSHLYLGFKEHLKTDLAIELCENNRDLYTLFCKDVTNPPIMSCYFYTLALLVGCRIRKKDLTGAKEMIDEFYNGLSTYNNVTAIWSIIKERMDELYNTLKDYPQLAFYSASRELALKDYLVSTNIMDAQKADYCTTIVEILCRTEYSKEKVYSEMMDYYRFIGNIPEDVIITIQRTTN